MARPLYGFVMMVGAPMGCPRAQGSAVTAPDPALADFLFPPQISAPHLQPDSEVGPLGFSPEHGFDISAGAAPRKLL